MKLPKFLLIAGLITSFSLLYVYQQTEVFRLAYLGQNSQTALDDLLDKNHILRYNIDSNASLVRIGEKISKQADFQMPESFELVRLTTSFEGRKGLESSRKQSLFARIFGIKRQAEAKTINP
ncbi:MAG: hypothetical protein KKC42_02040 [Candidatus Omnitrophica bacterium]|nr:hypothetical protein [Candidatus Omnitrophota bacterium]MBU1090612.1 hypothetical protein [Candidatus Omnitrophota bacterium]MBU1905918.1 hypothetical protein [Candidatus Omnitrophota bacterium]